MHKLSLYIIKGLFPVAILMLLPVVIYAQSGGTSQLLSIEAKAKQIGNDEVRMQELEKQKQSSYAEESKKLLQLKKELSDLHDEKINGLYELKNGYFCSDCKRPKSEIERAGINFDAHIREGAAGGRRRIPASAEVIAQKTAEYDSKIAAKEDQVKAFEFAENEFTRKRRDIDQQISRLKDNLDKLRKEITELSKLYKENVVKEAKARHKSMIGEILSTLAEKHYIEDRLNIIQVKLADLDNEEIKSIRELKEKVSKKVDNDKKVLNEKITSNKSFLQTLEQAFKTEERAKSSVLSTYKTRLTEVNKALLNKALKENEIAALEAEKVNLEQKISEQAAQIDVLRSDYKQQSDKIISENAAHSDKIWELTTTLPSIQDAAAAGLKTAFAAKRKILTDARSARTVSLDNTGRLLSDQRAAATKKNSTYLTLIDGERIRLLNACSKSGASCYGADTGLAVAGNWNRSLDCIGSFESAHNSNNPIYGCEEEAPLYRQKYQTLMNGLSDSDLEALQRTSNKTRYDMILKKVTN